jgi:transposase-like protein
MNKVQYIKLLAIRGITELNGLTIAEAVRRTGGEPTDKEMIEVNKQSMLYYIEKLEQEKIKNEGLLSIIKSQEDSVRWLNCLEAAGVDNWDGFIMARELYNTVL